MININQLKPISRKELLSQFSLLYYGNYKDWFLVVTPSNEICAMALKSFPDPEQVKNRFNKHTLENKEIRLSETTDLLLAGTAFQIQVWKALLDIPLGETWSYQKLADYIKMPKAVRAVANAVGANPISPLIPCHRIIRNDGSLGGYYWGEKPKLDLLHKEGVNITHLKKSLQTT